MSGSKQSAGMTLRISAALGKSSACNFSALPCRPYINSKVEEQTINVDWLLLNGQTYIFGMASLHFISLTDKAIPFISISILGLGLSSFGWSGGVAGGVGIISFAAMEAPC